MDSLGVLLLLILAMVSGIVLIIGGLYILNKQVVIRDSVTGEISEVEVPIFGKIKTNYPSLIAIFFGPTIIFYVVSVLPPLKGEPFPITGSFEADDKSIYDSAAVEIVPQGHSTPLNNDGSFYIKVPKVEDKMPYRAYLTYRNSDGKKGYKKAQVKQRIEKGNEIGYVSAKVRQF